MLVTVEEVKQYLKLDDYEEEDTLIKLLIENAEIYIEDAVCDINKMSEKSKKKAKLLALVLVSDLYENRSLNINATKNVSVSEKIRYTVQSMILQLKMRGD
ncbi:phage gp6-like head-tail connector protein [Clostridium botulinum D/C]|uniref:head-tail connector protein n=1 Tax=Clostridium botulinum TaxID=1491 RepID=UPI001E410D0B|nr:head-tail connector protein [Clostridium botulinum]MCD3351267.1 phage gp6-like head-tail connector protein [Clostridium botulinum D/C]MCD3360224.1 phage gp6-like head-tail connector protein [Clostridium botulinum D/C]MCD3361673.1 phage gp6-like head-tail connector protein [Clostridium botulinum D/C]MCD3366029.1 phage gp6-like head-tail connector protein [Clostridium botulinum D/C]